MHKVFFILLILFTCGNGQSNQNKLIINYQNQESLNINQKTSYVLIQLINKDCKLFFL